MGELNITDLRETRGGKELVHPKDLMENAAGATSF